MKSEFLLNCLAVECPELCLDWHPTKNLPLTPTNTSYGATKIVWWMCRVCKYEWQAHINNRRKQYKYPGQKGSSCPNCIGRVANEQTCFAAINPDLIEEWHPSKNLPATPYNILAQTSDKFYWICKICEFEWQASAGNRSCGAGCPSCGKFKNRKLAPNKKWQSLNQEIVLVSKK